MDSKVILAKAGSGKTYYICNNFDCDKRVLIISFTHDNLENIRRELRCRFNGRIPNNIDVSTYDSFLYNHLLRPLEPFSKFENLSSRGVDVKSKVISDGRNKAYIKEKFVRHYVNSNNQYYVTRMGKLFFKEKDGFKKIALRRLEKYFDMIFIDEFQDFAGSDFKVIKYLLGNLKIKVVAVGDLYQSNVTPIRNDGRGSSSPYDKVNNISDFRDHISKNIEIDTETLKKSRRLGAEVCSLITNYMNIDIQSYDMHSSDIIWLDGNHEISKVMKDKNITKLIYNRGNINNFGINFKTWSYSKGDTYDSACVILTDKANDPYDWNKLRTSTRNKLYVALTRAKNNVYILRNDIYKKWKNDNGID